MDAVNPLQGTGRRVIGEMMLKKERRAHGMDAILHVLSITSAFHSPNPTCADQPALSELVYLLVTLRMLFL
jgi:hypothetical protein